MSDAKDRIVNVSVDRSSDGKKGTVVVTTESGRVRSERYDEDNWGVLGAMDEEEATQWATAKALKK